MEGCYSIWEHVIGSRCGYGGLRVTLLGDDDYGSYATN
jgi:hypothetical protein